jgi:hypothetical protein
MPHFGGLSKKAVWQNTSDESETGDSGKLPEVFGSGTTPVIFPDGKIK